MPYLDVFLAYSDFKVFGELQINCLMSVLPSFIMALCR
jgi:hypothetical protein